MQTAGILPVIGIYSLHIQEQSVLLLAVLVIQTKPLTTSMGRSIADILPHFLLVKVIIMLQFSGKKKRM